MSSLNHNGVSKYVVICAVSWKCVTSRYVLSDCATSGPNKYCPYLRCVTRLVGTKVRTWYLVMRRELELSHAPVFTRIPGVTGTKGVGDIDDLRPCFLGKCTMN